MAFAVAEARPATDLDISLDRVVNSFARRNLPATCELVEVAKAVNRLRQSKYTNNITQAFNVGM